MSNPAYVFVNRVYPPVGGATGELLKELAEALVADGARVIVITSRGPAELRLPSKETVNGVELVRVGSAPFTKASHWKRGLSYLGLYPQLAWELKKLGPVDAVVSMTDPPLQVAALALFSGQAHKTIHWAQDIYPELAEQLGVLSRGGVVARLLRSLSTWALRRQNDVVAVGRCMRERLVARGIDAARIEVIPNWSCLTPPAPDEVAAMRKRLGWENKFVALYSGNIGLAHDFETLSAAAKMVAGSKVSMVFAGEGAGLDRLRKNAEHLEHVTFLPPQAKEHLSAFLAAADIHLVCVRSGLKGLVVPSKVYGSVAVGRPVLYVGEEGGEAALLSAGLTQGVVVRNGDPSSLADALRKASEVSLKRDGSEPAVSPCSETFPQALAMWRDILQSEG